MTSWFDTLRDLPVCGKSVASCYGTASAMWLSACVCPGCAGGDDDSLPLMR